MYGTVPRTIASRRLVRVVFEWGVAWRSLGHAFVEHVVRRYKGAVALDHFGESARVLQ